VSSTVDFTLGDKDKTFVAPCIGGPHDGKLARASLVLQAVIVGGAFYALRTCKEGSFWEFDERLSSR
jgi:hypothetical protein